MTAVNTKRTANLQAYFIDEAIKDTFKWDLLQEMLHLFRKILPVGDCFQMNMCALVQRLYGYVIKKKTSRASTGRFLFDQKFRDFRSEIGPGERSKACERMCWRKELANDSEQHVAYKGHERPLRGSWATPSFMRPAVAAHCV